MRRSPASTVAGILTAIEVTDVAKSVSICVPNTGKAILVVPILKIRVSTHEDFSFYPCLEFLYHTDS